MVATDELECPACGCNETEIVKLVVRWGQPSERRECCHCGKGFTVPAPPTEELPKDLACVKYHVLRCPKCGSTNVNTSKTRKEAGLRRHKCLEDGCGHPFKSVEERS